MAARGSIAIIFTIFTGYINVATGNAFNMASGDELQTLSGTLLASSGGFLADGVSAAGSVQIEIGGTVGGYSGVYDTLSSGQSSYVFIEKTGDIVSSNGGFGLEITGAGSSAIVDNAGFVQSIGGSGWSIYADKASQVINDAPGVISANVSTVRAQSYFS